jgi:hypothetical protein
MFTRNYEDSVTKKKVTMLKLRFTMTSTEDFVNKDTRRVCN